jgi:L-cysteate sulfo-lyase
MGTDAGSGGPNRILLGTWPTPVERAPRLAERLGMHPGALWVKRDDLTGLGAGGNKVRKLEYLAAASRDKGADVLLTSGRAQSNHALLTAAAARRLGMDCVLVLAGETPTIPTGNLALESFLGVRIVWVGEADDDELDRQVDVVAAETAREGHRVELIPLGGSNALGAWGYIECGRELSAQVPGVRHVVVALGSGGTMAGLVGWLGADRVLGVDVGATADPVQRVAGTLAGLAGEGDVTPTSAAALRVRRDQIGAGYGALTSGSARAIIDAAECEGIFLDPVYTAKALSGLAAAVREGDIGPDETTVFVHTGGLPGLFGHDLMRDPAVVRATAQGDEGARSSTG